MNKKVILHIIFTLSLCCVVCFSGCKKNDNDSDKLFNKAAKIYTEKGFDKFSEFVTENKYFAIKYDAENGATPLLVAVKNKNIDAVKLFINQGASFEETDNSNNGVIDYAILAESSEEEEGFLGDICDLIPNSFFTSNVANSKNKSSDDYLVKLICNSTDYNLIKRVADLFNVETVFENGKTYLMFAAQCNTDVRVTKLFLDKGANKDIRNNNEWTAAMYAARYNPNPIVLEELIRRGADTESNSAGLSLIMLAACNENPGVLFTLFNYFDDVNAVTTKGKTALMYACENKQNSSVIKILLDNGADFNLKDSNGKTALMYGLEAYTEPDALYLLVAAGADKSAVDNNGKTVKDYFMANKVLANTDFKNAFELETSNDEIITDLPEEKESTMDAESTDEKLESDIKLDDETDNNVETELETASSEVKTEESSNNVNSNDNKSIDEKNMISENQEVTDL